MEPPSADKNSTALKFGKSVFVNVILSENSMSILKKGVSIFLSNFVSRKTDWISVVVQGKGQSETADPVIIFE